MLVKFHLAYELNGEVIDVKFLQNVVYIISTLIS